MKLALAGVGPWGRLLAQKCQEAGAEIVAHARAQGPDAPGLGRRVPMDSLCQQPDVAGLIIATPPEVTRLLAHSAASAGIAVLATKPLQLGARMDVRAPFFVDYVRLWSPFYTRLKSQLAGRVIRRIEVQAWGPGPYRAFSSLDDYGPHALSFVHDLLGVEQGVSHVQASPPQLGERGATMHAARARVGEVQVCIEVGNAAPAKRMRLLVEVDGLGAMVYEESGHQASFSLNGQQVEAGPHDPLALMVRQFLRDCQEERLDARFVQLSVAVTRSLALMRDAECKARLSGGSPN